MLDHEQPVKEDAEESEQQLGRSGHKSKPVVPVVGEQDGLRQAGGAPGDVQKHVGDGPFNSTLSAVVHVGLGDVFDHLCRRPS